MRTLTFLVISVVIAASCRPIGLAGDPCATGPCAAGLLCIDDLCQVPPPPPVPDCLSNEDCRIDGLFTGQICVDEECVSPGCAGDEDCGVFICELGECVEPVPCEQDGDCGIGRVCESEICRDGCDIDDECGLFNVCQDARCFQQCLGFDFLCFGDICEDGVCLAPECGNDEDCPEGNLFCDGGRCESFTPCQRDIDCFDPDFRCNDLERCEERPLCTTDTQCGTSALCIGDHCRPVDTCELDADCIDDRECVAGRCVQRPQCRDDDQCAANERCTDLTCSAIEAGLADSIVVVTPFGSCDNSGQGACRLLLFQNETVTFRAGAFDAVGLPVDVAFGAAATIGTADLDDDTIVYTATQPGNARVDVTSGTASHDEIAIGIIPFELIALRVLVTEADGAPVAGATVDAGVEVGLTDDSGVARFTLEPAADPLSSVRATLAGRSVMALDVTLTGDMRLQLPRLPAPALESAAGLTSTVLSTGDELGPVGVGIVIPRFADEDEATLALFGDTFAAGLELPLIGNIPVALPGGVTLSAALPVLGDQVVKDRAFIATSGGPASVTALEGRFAQNDLLGIFGGGDAVEVALNLAAVAEGMDLEVRFTGSLDELPLIADAADIDGDGNTGELVPDYEGFPSLEIRPERRPDERVGITTGILPNDARARALVAVGHDLPGIGTVVTGIGIANGGEEQVKARAPSTGALSRARRFIRAEAILDAGESSLLRELDAFSNDLDLGAWIEPPVGATLFTGPASQTLGVPGAPGATTMRVQLDAGDLLLDVIVSASSSGRVIVLDDPALDGAIIREVEALRLFGATPDAATQSALRRVAPLDFERRARARF